ncbi:site-specific DNA-methyltransferase [Treponema rectale]|uniref:site-specific DNA-methyltransferase (adenine-specific) n=1 Tax=Treponema rectale TaxID=744512 RepID=A0A840SGN1_9SPIR|nr:site-specific DNA-methyltransferase [Treponema rectale]MBB5219066.1 adenine-specific DNA-methyltransferase [Treponema rectale]QOS41027.1 site-specific DNA-methyltransferase [Treponema rectale]
MEHLHMHSLNKIDENISKIANLFPNCVTEAKNDNGEIVHKIDFDMLKQELSSVLVEEREERYQFTWPDKKQAILTANAPINKTLRPCREESVDFDTTENLYIEGDNLEALKLLQETYLGRIKMIYIDPPYNTGSDFIYNDNFDEAVDEYTDKNGDYDVNGNQLVKNLETEGRFHTKWLNMMYPRLKIARDLLKDDGGIICIQIDDNEYANLKKICDEIFNISNFVTTIVVKMSEPTGVKMSHAKTRIPKLKEYILVYKKGDIKLNSVRVPKEKWDNEYKTYLTNITQEELDFVKSIRDNEDRTDKEIQEVDEILKKISFVPITTIYNENNIITDDDKLNFNYSNSWRIIRTVSMSGGAKEIADEKKKQMKQTFFNIVTPEKKMYFIKGDYSSDVESPRIKILFADDYLTFNPCDFYYDIKTTGLDNEGYVPFRNGKKPIKLLTRLIKLFTNDNDIVMDFFSGSCSTGHSVMQFCNEENSKRPFIMVQLQEDIDSQLTKVDKETKKDLIKINAFLDKYGKPHYITEVGKQRLRLAGNDINNNNVDKGFRVLKIDSTNMEDVYYTPDHIDPNDLFKNNIKSDRTGEDLLFQTMLDLGIMLSSKIETKKINGKEVFCVEGNYLMACFDDTVDEATITEIAKEKPYYFVMRAPANSKDGDSLITNFEQIFTTYSPDTVRKIL